MKKLKTYQDENVFEATLKRIEYLYTRYDNIAVAFSGGKDSTAVLNLTVMVATKLNRLPVHAIFIDEEAIHPTTVDYVDRVSKRDDVRVSWLCLEMKHRNACSNDEPYWYTWDADQKEKWVRDLPPQAITTHPKFKKGMTHDFFIKCMFDQSQGATCVLTGIRTEESYRRYVSCSSKEEDNYITLLEGAGNVAQAHPIYDWMSTDVWLLINKFGFDYNTTYDIFNRTKKHNRFLAQRVCPPFGEEPLRQLWIYAECFPELWHKMLYRVKGVATAWRYANTELYGIGKREKPDHLTWKQFTHLVLDTYPAKTRAKLIQNINMLVKRHYKYTNDPILDEGISPISGLDWKFLSKLAIKGDFKNRTKESAALHAYAEAKRRGMDMKTSAEFYGTEKFKESKARKSSVRKTHST